LIAKINEKDKPVKLNNKQLLIFIQSWMKTWVWLIRIVLFSILMHFQIS